MADGSAEGEVRMRLIILLSPLLLTACATHMPCLSTTEVRANYGHGETQGEFAMAGVSLYYDMTGECGN